MQATGCNSLLVSDDTDRYYLSGFRGTAGYLLLNADRAVLAVDFRYTEQAGRQAPGCKIMQINGDLASFLPDLLKDMKAQVIGVDPDKLTHSAHQHLNTLVKKSGARLKKAAGLVAGLRGVKDSYELDLISQAAEITVDAFRHVAEFLRPGLTELELAWEIERFMREHGSEPIPFPVIAASGPNAALPHAQPSERAIQDCETVVVDIGASVNGYTSDMTRTFCAGKPDGRFKEIHDIVSRAQREAFTGLKAGITGAALDKIARDVIAEAGYGKSFGHALGHGVGLETHEAPRIGPRSRDIIEDGIVITIEPGIYLPGWGGIRIEDDVVLQEGRPFAFSILGEI